MSLEENKAIIRKMVRAFNKKDLAVIDEFIAPDYVDHTNQLRGRENVRRFYTMVFKDFPDFHRTIEDIDRSTTIRPAQTPRSSPESPDQS